MSKQWTWGFLESGSYKCILLLQELRALSWDVLWDGLGVWQLIVALTETNHRGSDVTQCDRWHDKQRFVTLHRWKQHTQEEQQTNYKLFEKSITVHFTTIYHELITTRHLTDMFVDAVEARSSFLCLRGACVLLHDVDVDRRGRFTESCCDFRLLQGDEAAFCVWYLRASKRQIQTIKVSEDLTVSLGFRLLRHLFHVWNEKRGSTLQQPCQCSSSHTKQTLTQNLQFLH